MGYGVYNSINASKFQKKDAFMQYSPGMLSSLSSAHSPSLIHLSGDKCIICKIQWMKVDKSLLKSEAAKRGYEVYEYNIDPATWGAVLKEMSPYGVFGVPDYVFINKDGKVKVLTSISGTEDLLREMV